MALCQEFDPFDTEILAQCYPIESLSKFELKTSETDGWLEIPIPKFLIRRSCIISLPFSICHLPSWPGIARVTYTGGFVLPATEPSPPVPPATPLPSDLENACVEQVAFWFQNRDKLGLKTNWPKDAAYQQFATQDLLPSVSAILQRYRRILV